LDGLEIDALSDTGNTDQIEILKKLSLSSVVGK